MAYLFWVKCIDIDAKNNRHCMLINWINVIIKNNITIECIVWMPWRRFYNKWTSFTASYHKYLSALCIQIVTNACFIYFKYLWCSSSGITKLLLDLFCISVIAYVSVFCVVYCCSHKRWQNHWLILVLNSCCLVWFLCDNDRIIGWKQMCSVVMKILMCFCGPS